MENKSLVNQILHNQKVTEYGYDGYGIVRINNNYPILVENALKDEIVDVQVIQQNANDNNFIWRSIEVQNTSY